MVKSSIINFDEFQIKVNYKKIKNIILKINKNKVIELSVPIRITESEIYLFLEQKKFWIKKTLDKYQNINPNDFYYLGKKFEILYEHHNSRNIKTSIDGSYFRVFIHEALPTKTRDRILNKLFEENLREIVREFFEKWEMELGISKNSLEIKKMKGKWGYCHTKNHDICLNLDLIKMDLKFIEYVVLHELCHILVPNHGPEFKKLLNYHMPNWKSIEKECSI